MTDHPSPELTELRALKAKVDRCELVGPASVHIAGTNVRFTYADNLLAWLREPEQ